jgi:putative methionine-R-sulfoxide reductase with GAF domain
VFGEGEDDPADRLRNILAVTDSSLGRLDVEDLLVELLDRVREILAVDTAAVLLLDEPSQELVARAACGIEEEVRQGVRVPVGRGFAGRIAQTRGPVVLDRVDSTTVANPLLWERGIQAMLGVPLLSKGRLLGVLHVGTLGDRRFTDGDKELLELVAERVAAATQAHLTALDRAAARVLERSLMPTPLPNSGILTLAARYIPAGGSGVGGDWYDVFRLPNGSMWLVTGDVAGHGLRAAVIMGRIRSALRAYALLGGPPEEVVALTDHKVRHFEPGAMATVICAAIAPPFDTIKISSAGHLPPVLAAPGRPAAVVDVRADPPLGLAPRTPRSSVTAPFGPGSVLVLYTDGLVERRGELIDEGIDRLLSVVTADEPEMVCSAVTRRLIGRSTMRDDIAIIAARRATRTIGAQGCGQPPGRNLAGAH